MFARLASHFGLNGLVQGANILTSLVFVALIPYEEIAIYAITVVVSGLLCLLGTMRMEWVVLNTSKVWQAKIAVSCGLIVASLVAPLSLLVMAAFYQLEWLNYQKTSLTVIALASVFVFTFITQRLFITYHLMRERIRSNLWMRMLHAGTRLGLAVALSLLFPVASSMLLSDILASMVVIAWMGNWRDFTDFFRRFRLKFQWIYRRHRNILLFATPSAMINSLGNSLIPTVMVTVSGLEAGGIIYAVQRVASLPVKMITTAVGEAWHKLIQVQNPRALSIAMSPAKIGAAMAISMIVCLVGMEIAFWIAQLLPWYDTVPKYTEIVDATYNYRLAVAMIFAVSLFDRVVIIREAIAKIIVFDLLMVCIPLLLLWIVPAYNLDIMAAITALALLQSAAYLYYVGLILYESWRWH